MSSDIGRWLWLFVACVGALWRGAWGQCLDWMDGFGEDAWGASGFVHAVISGEAHGEQSIYVAGEFGEIGGIDAARIARWDGAVWSGLGEGLSGGMAYAMCWYDDGSGMALYAAGSFRLAGGEACGRVARWRDGRWEDIGAALNQDAACLAVHRGALYVGGEFTEAAGKATRGLAAWDGSSWSVFPDGPATRIGALASFDPGTGAELIAGGEYPGFGGQSKARIASLHADGTWHALGVGPDGPCAALAVVEESGGSRLYVGGEFANTDGQKTTNMASWDGAAWSRVGGGPANGGGVNGRVTGLAVLPDGAGWTLGVVGGFSRTMTGITARQFIEWDGSGWIAPATGLITFEPLAVSSAPFFGERFVAVGGKFHEAGEKPSRYFAVYGVACSAPTVVSQPESVVADFGDSVNFHVECWGTQRIRYQWFKDGVALEDDGRVEGATGPWLSISPWEWGDEGQYGCRATNDLGAVLSELATLVLPGGDLPVVPVETVLVTPGVSPWDAGFVIDGMYDFSQFGPGAFAARAIDPGDVSAVVTYHDGAWAEAARQGGPVPGGEPEETFSDGSGAFGSLRSGGDGGVAFRGEVEGPGVGRENDEGAWALTGQGLEVVAREGDPAPGLGEGVLFGQGTPLDLSQGAEGRTLVSGWATGGAFGEASLGGLWQKLPGQEAEIIGLDGWPAPGTETVYDGYGLCAAAPGGGVLFKWGLDSYTGHKNFGYRDQGLWIGAPDDPRLIVKSGDHAPGFDPEVNFEFVLHFVRAPLFNYHSVVWDGRVAGPDGFDGAGVYRSEGAAISAVAVTGTVAPTPDGTRVLQWPRPLALNGRDEVLIESTSQGMPYDRYWLVRADGSLQHVARESQSFPPGCPPGLRIRGFVRGAMNDLQHVAIEVSADNAGGLNGVLGWTTNRGAFPLLVPGSRVAVGPDDTRVVRSASLLGTQIESEPPTAHGLAPDGRCMVHVSFAGGGSGVFVARFQDFRDAYFTCPGDFNGDGLIDTRDVVAFLGAWARGDWAADVNGDARITSTDVLHFLADWTRGC